MADGVQVLGLKELTVKFKQLEAPAKEKVLRGTLRASIQPVVTAAKANARRGDRSGALSTAISAWTTVERQTVNLAPVLGKSIARVVSRPNLGARVGAWVGPRSKDRKAVAQYNDFYGTRIKGIFHGHFIEFGTVDGTPARPFLRPAMDQNQQTVVNNFRLRFAAKLR